MTAPTSIPLDPLATVGLTPDDLWHCTFRSMASPVRLQLGFDTARPERRHAEVRALFAEVRALFAEVERQCTRFDPTSDLMRANAAGRQWHPVGGYCFAAIEAAAEAHATTGGVFDPRVLTTLADLGYAASLPFADGDLRLASRTSPRPAGLPRARWEPGLDPETRSVRIGREAVDLGGIGKGLALRWAAGLLRAAGCATFLLDAGGDCVASGGGPDGSGWRIGVEDPAGGSEPVAVLSVEDAACATSSIRLRHWRVGDDEVHHLIDPATGRPGGAGLRSVTVVADDPARAEVWSKALFLHGAGIAAAAEREGLAALWVHADGQHDVSLPLAADLIWRRA